MREAPRARPKDELRRSRCRALDGACARRSARLDLPHSHCPVRARRDRWLARGGLTLDDGFHLPLRPRSGRGANLERRAKSNSTDPYGTGNRINVSSCPLEFHPRFEVLVSEVCAPKPGLMHTGEEAKPLIALL